MTTNNNLEIRSDLTDISNTVKHLYILSNYFEKRRKKFERLWYSNDEGFISSIYLTKDADFIGIVERLYQIGKNSAGTLVEQLPLINEIEVYPKIKDYIDTIEAYRKNWEKDDKKLIKKCEKIILQRTYKLNYWNIEEMLKMHKDTLMILESIESDLNTIRNSKRYKIENITSIEEILKNKKKITDKQNEDYEKYGYKCFDKIYIPGERPIQENCRIILNGKDTLVDEANFKLLLRLVIQIKNGKNEGWVNMPDIITDESPFRTVNDYHNYIYRLRKDLSHNLLNQNPSDFIVNNTIGNYKITTDPDNITYNRENLMKNFLNDQYILKLAEQLP